MTPTADGARCAAALLCALAGLSPATARAQSWSLQTGASAKLEANDNPNLAATAGDTLTTTTLAGSLAALRQTENSELRADADLSLVPQRQDRGTQANGRLGLQHSMQTARSSWSANMAWRRDETLDAPALASEVLLGPGSRNVRELLLNGSWAFSERLQLQWNGSHSHTRYGAAAGGALAAGSVGSDFSQATLGGGLRWRQTETRSLGLNLSRTQTHLAGGDNRSRIDGFRVTASEALSERSSLSLSLGRYATTRDRVFSRLVCPLQVQLCQAGLVPYVLAQSSAQARSSEAQYSASFGHRWREGTGLQASASRALTPGALGVTREESVGASLDHSFSETLSAGLNLSQSRSSVAAAGGELNTPSARLQTLGLVFSRRLGEQLKLNGELLHRRFITPQLSATANVVSITLQYQAGTLSR